MKVHSTSGWRKCFPPVKDRARLQSGGIIRETFRRLLDKGRTLASRASGLLEAALATRLLVLALSAAVFGCAAHSSNWSDNPEVAERTRKVEASFRVAMLLVADLKCSEAIRKLLPLIQEFEALGNRPRAAEAAFWTGYCHEKAGEPSKARAFYNMVVKQYPDTLAARQAADRLIRLGAEQTS